MKYSQQIYDCHLYSRSGFNTYIVLYYKKIYGKEPLSSMSLYHNEIEVRTRNQYNSFYKKEL